MLEGEAFFVYDEFRRIPGDGHQASACNAGCMPGKGLEEMIAQKIMLVGEPMALFIAQQPGPLHEAASFSAGIAGAEYNVAVGLRRLGHEAGYLTRLGRDPFGKRIAAQMEKNGLDLSLVSYSRERATGFMLKAKSSLGDPDIFYFRKNSAASELDEASIDRLDMSGFRYLHLTGIFPALSEQTWSASLRLLERAKENRLTVFFDPNLRPQLWKDKALMCRRVNLLARRADYFLPGTGEGEILMGSREAGEIARYYRAQGVPCVVVKTGPKGALAAVGEEMMTVSGYRVDRVVDTVGAGDGFAAGFISAVAEGLPLEAAVLRANAVGAIQVMHESDNEGLPARAELGRFMAAVPRVEET